MDGKKNIPSSLYIFKFGKGNSRRQIQTTHLFLDNKFLFKQGERSKPLSKALKSVMKSLKLSFSISLLSFSPLSRKSQIETSVNYEIPYFFIIRNICFFSADYTCFQNSSLSFPNRCFQYHPSDAACLNSFCPHNPVRTAELIDSCTNLNGNTTKSSLPAPRESDMCESTNRAESFIQFHNFAYIHISPAWSTANHDFPQVYHHCGWFFSLDKHLKTIVSLTLPRWWASAIIIQQKISKFSLFAIRKTCVFSSRGTSSQGIIQHLYPLIY